MKLSKMKYSQSLHSQLKANVMLLFALLFTAIASAQFSVSVVASTPETCPGNGTITLAAQNADPSAPVNYVVYLLPNTTAAVWNSANPVVTGLTDGTYQVTATQIINGNLVSTPPQQVVIADNTSIVTFTLAGTNAICGPDGVITVTVTNGTALSYEILTGPVTRPPQSSHIFNDLPAGVYSVRVTDPCGFSIPQTITVFSSEPILNVSAAAFPDIELPACDLVTVKHLVQAQAGIPISYPLNVVITVHPPGGGAPIVFTQTIAGGDPSEVEFEQIIPLYYDQDYTYTLEVSDACNTYTQTQQMGPGFSAGAGYDDAGCDGKYLILTLNKFVGPYTVNFTSFPPGFDPHALQPTHPGPFTGAELDYGDETTAVPEGEYTGSITDACGRTSNFATEIIIVEDYPFASTTAASCSGGLGGATVNIPGVVIAQAHITVAPDEYEALHPLPDDVMEFWDADELEIVIPDLPPGNYVIVLIDECGKVYDPLDFEIEIGTTPPTIAPRVDCTEGKGTVRITTPNLPITMVKITGAPVEFVNTLSQPLPYDVSFNIFTNDNFYMDNLPPGQYFFEITDNCSTQIRDKVVNAYSILSSETSITMHCGSFDLYLNHQSTANAGLGFWLQKYNEVTGTWGHPGTGVPYPEGTEPVPANSVVLTNNATNFSLPYNGEFRILKYFVTYNSGSIDKDKICIEIIEPSLTVPEGVIIESVVKISCDGEAATDVQVNAIGAEPLNYVIVEKNGQPFTIDNGTDNVFTDLDDATYKVQVSDPCGYSTPRVFTIGDLPSVVTANPVGNMSTCDGNNDNLETFNLAAQTPIILGLQDPDNVTITYHANLPDAEAGINPLPDSYTTGSTTIYARAVNSVNVNCKAITSFEVILSDGVVITMPDEWHMCEGSITNIFAPPGFVSYEWSTGATSQFITVNQGGAYWVKVTNQNQCTGIKDITVITSPLPYISHINTTDWTNENNTITVVVEPSSLPQHFEYSLDGINYQPDPNFYDLGPGPYTVFVRDIYGCGSDDDKVFLLTYPKFFTPNGDSINETWRIQYSIAEPNLMVYIYDRYGKIVSSFEANSNGWDGTFNGEKLPATDYWFVVKRENGQEMRGHFAMIR